MSTGAPLPPQSCDHESHCITCGDEAVAMRVLRIDELRELALCETAGGEWSTVEIALVAPVARGDELLVHAGTAIARAA
jgi:hydrogenase maturation factor